MLQFRVAHCGSARHLLLDIQDGFASYPGYSVRVAVLGL